VTGGDVAAGVTGEGWRGVMRAGFGFALAAQGFCFEPADLLEASISRFRR